MPAMMNEAMSDEPPDDMKGKVFFINADREYKEGKNKTAFAPKTLRRFHTFI